MTCKHCDRPAVVAIRTTAPKGKSGIVTTLYQHLEDAPKTASGYCLHHGMILAASLAGLAEAHAYVDRSGPDLHSQWRSGDRVEQVTRLPYGPEEIRPGEVVAVDEELRVHQFLRVRFDDGEERHINPDVMRTQREGEAP